jgi:LPXTG-motif cell wall-anchored protein
MVKRMLVAAVMTLGILAAPAAAQQYPPADNSITVSDTSVTPGQTIDITVRHCEPGSTASFTLTSDPVDLGTAVADEAGVASLSATIPENTSLGRHTITARGGDLALRAAIPVDPAAAGGAAGGPGGALPRTGDNSSIPLARVGLGLAAVGGVLTALAAKRRKQAAAA